MMNMVIMMHVKCFEKSIICLNLLKLIDLIIIIEIFFIIFYFC